MSIDRSRSYIVLMRRNADGVKRLCPFAESEWGEASGFEWRENNYSCDCNREWFFQRAADEDERENPDCGGERYSVLAVWVGNGEGGSVYADDGEAWDQAWGLQ